MNAIIMVGTADCMIECKGEARWCTGDNKTHNTNQLFKRVQLQ